MNNEQKKKALKEAGFEIFFKWAGTAKRPICICTIQSPEQTYEGYSEKSNADHMNHVKGRTIAFNRAANKIENEDVKKLVRRNVFFRVLNKKR